MRIKNSEYYFLRGGGEMGELIRAMDWSKTSLGDPAGWPHSLRTMVAVMLDNPFGMYIAWGNEYIQLYNDGYRPILGATKHPQALGIKTSETFPEIWHIVEPMFDGVMKGEAVGVTDFMYLLNRNGYEEECYFDFSYSPIRIDNGEVGGVLVTVIETTEKKRATEALRESNARYIGNIMHAPVAMCIFRGNNFVVEIANEQMLALWGKQAEQVMNKPIFVGLPEVKDQGLESLLENVYNTGEKFVANERPVNLPRNGKVETTYVNFVYEALKEADGTISGIVAIAIEVTPQVIARSKVENSEQKVRALVENAPFPIAVYVGKEMIVELANQSIIDIWGKGNDVIGKPFKEVLPELDNQLVFEQIEKVLTTGEPFHTENTRLDLIVDSKLRTYYFNYSFTPLYDTARNIYGVMNTGVDLTDLNVAKKRIEESDKRFRSTVKQAPVGMTILRGSKYVVEMANDAYLQLVDKKEEEFVGKALFDVLPEVEESVHSLLDSVLNTGVPYHGNEVAIPVNRYGKQETYHFDFLYHPLKDEDGKISGVIVTVTEVSEKVEARKKIEESEKRFRSLAESLPQLIWETDEKGNAMYASGRWKEYTGITPAGEAEWKAVVHPDDLEKNATTWMHSLATGELYRCDVRLKSKDGDYRWHRVVGDPVFDQESKIVKWVGAFTDIHTEKAFTQELEKQVAARTKELEDTNLQLGKMNKELKTFAYISSHDLQEPLRKIQTFSTQIVEKESQNLSEEGKDKFRRMGNAANRMQTLIDDLLAYSRTTTQERKFEKADLSAIVEEIKDDLKEELQQKHATIENNEMCEAKIIPFQFRQLLLNLINNSLKFSNPKKNPHIEIKSEIAEGIKFNNKKLAKDVKYCHIRFSDNGIGFEQQYSEKIFELFQRLNGKSEYAGTGIGLSIVKRIVENHNGVITASGELDKGATFDIYIPAT